MEEGAGFLYVWLPLNSALMHKVYREIADVCNWKVKILFHTSPLSTKQDHILELKLQQIGQSGFGDEKKS